MEQLIDRAEYETEDVMVPMPKWVLEHLRSGQCLADERGKGCDLSDVITSRVKRAVRRE